MLCSTLFLLILFDNYLVYYRIAILDRAEYCGLSNLSANLKNNNSVLYFNVMIDVNCRVKTDVRFRFLL